MTEANVYKRLGRARARFREVPLHAADLMNAQLASRLPAVQVILYALFTEGYLSSYADGAIRRELCDDALRLTEVLAEVNVRELGRADERTSELEETGLQGAGRFV